MTIKLNYFNLGIIFSSLLSFILTMVNCNNFAPGYSIMIMFPVIFIMLYILILQKQLNKGYSFTMYGIIFIEWIRFVLMPPLCAMSGIYCEVPYIIVSEETINIALILMVFELLFISLFVMLYIPRKNYVESMKDMSNIKLKGNKIIYSIFLTIFLIIIFTIGKSNKLVNFLYIPIGNERLGDITETYLVLARQIIIIGMFLMFLIVVNFCKQKYEINKNKKYLYLSILFAMVNVAIIVGERRSAQIYTTIISIWILSKLFPEHKSRILISIGGLGTAILIIMSVYKFFLAFNYGSYMGAVANANVDSGWIARNLQSYFLGPQNIAASIEFSNLYNLNIENLLYDLSRSIFGTSFIMKGRGVLTSALFNTYLYGRITESGHIISSIGYGYIYMNAILSPLLVLVNIYISFFVERKLMSSRSYEGIYVWGYILVRYCTNLFVNPLPLINYSSIILGTAGLLFFVAIFLNFKSNKRKISISYQ